MNFPSELKALEWFTEEKDLPSEPTNDVFMVKAVDVDTKEESYSLAMFVYWPIREPIDYDEWRFICGTTCFARESSDNKYNVVAWSRLKLEYL